MLWTAFVIGMAVFIIGVLSILFRWFEDDIHSKIDKWYVDTMNAKKGGLK